MYVHPSRWPTPPRRSNILYTDAARASRERRWSDSLESLVIIKIIYTYINIK